MEKRRVWRVFVTPAGVMEMGITGVLGLSNCSSCMQGTRKGYRKKYHCREELKAANREERVRRCWKKIP